MGKMANVVSKAHDVNDRKKCSVGLFIRDLLSPEERKEFADILADLDLSAPSIRVAVKDEYDVLLSPTQITRHRGGGCSCP